MRKKRGGRWGKKYEDKRDWKEYNEELVRRGELYLSLDFLERWGEEVRKMNEGKRGRPFRFPEAFVEWMALLHVWFFMPFRQMEGFLRALSQHAPLEPADYTTLFKRIKGLKLDLSSTIVAGSDVVIAVDSTGIRVTNRGEWMREKWNNHRGWIKVHLSVDVESKQILGLEITNEEVGDADMFPSLLEQSKANSKGVIKVLADGAYDDRHAFNLLKKGGIESGIKTRSNASTKSHGSLYRAQCVRERQNLGYKEWSKKKGYGKRWGVEGVISVVKRIFGETVRAASIQGMYREMRTKLLAYNILLNMI
ncbi:IS5-like element ISMeco1 family transposase [Methanocella conradii]|nr:IS5-like element ISMeco1 family transposase [Methanocella conradii]